MVKQGRDRAMRFVVAHMGARRNYAVPLVLEQAGMLERFYTDLAGNVGLGTWLVKCGPLLGCRKAAAKLAGRRVPEVIRRKTVSLFAGKLWLRSIPRKDDSDRLTQFDTQLRRSRAFGCAAMRRGFGGATHLYSMLGECGPLIGAAKDCGLSVVTEIYILLSAERIVAEEQRKFPEWESEPINFDRVRNKFAEQRELLRHTDYAVCPSQRVQGDLDKEFGFGKGQSVVVPYGVDASWLKATVQPARGRVLFVGTAGLRKGTHHLAKAAELLQGRGREYEFRIAGEVTKRIAGRRECRHLSFLGRVPRDQVQAEFASADVFVLPSLAEGSAEATYEALAAGLPVITTEAAGSVVRHGIDGWIVPERDSVALAEAIERIVGDRHLRATMSLAARERAREYTVERYGERLVAALQRLRA